MDSLTASSSSQSVHLSTVIVEYNEEIFTTTFSLQNKNMGMDNISLAMWTTFGLILNFQNSLENFEFTLRV